MPDHPPSLASAFTFSLPFLSHVCLFRKADPSIKAHQYVFPPSSASPSDKHVEDTVSHVVRFAVKGSAVSQALCRTSPGCLRLAWLHVCHREENEMEILGQEVEDVGEGRRGEKWGQTGELGGAREPTGQTGGSEGSA